MNRKLFWRSLLIVLVIVWSAIEIYPPTDRDLIQFFREKAVNRDQTFATIYTRAQELQKQRPGMPYENLQEAIGNNSITNYFPFYEAQKQTRPTTFVLNRLQREAAGRVKLGLDLQGGVAITVQLTNRPVELPDQTNGVATTESTQISSESLHQAVEVLRKRVDRFGVAEPVIQPEGRDRIRIQLPGLSHAQMETAKETIQKVAYLEFCLVHPRSDELLESKRPIPPGYHVLVETKLLPNGTQETRPYVVRKKPEMVGGIARAGIGRDNVGSPEILFVLDAQHAQQFARITRQNVGRQLAIVLDGELQSAPVIQTPIEHGNGQITGDFTDQAAFTLRNVLENPLETPVQIVSSSEVDPTLGADSITSGIKASIIGILAVAAFMLVYYLWAGMVANVALVLNIVILMGVMCAIEATLTLPGIAGVVLTIGMAVDANVLIYERIREELAAGKSMRGALAAGYNKAFGTIFDSNLTTLIAAVILIFLGAGPIKGFGVTLTVGIAVSMFTALVVTRVIFDFFLARGILKTLPMLHVVRNTKINFLRWAVPAFAASWLLILVGNSYGIFVRGADVLGVEFSGGETAILSFDQAHKVGVDKLRAAAGQVTQSDVLLSYQRDVSTGRETLLLTTRASGQGGEAGVADKVIKKFTTSFPDAGFKTIGRTVVGPTVGMEIQQSAIISCLLALLGILIYVAFRYEFSFSVGAVVAIIHDVLMTLGWYFMSGRELNGLTVAALLTIIGFSINDTIVIFDRIREDLKLGVRGTFRDVINRALNETLSRTIITSGTVFLSTLSLLIFGGGVINDFAFTFLIGIMAGTYSTIYIASALVLWWHKGQRPKIGASQAITAETISSPAGG